MKKGVGHSVAEFLELYLCAKRKNGKLSGEMLEYLRKFSDSKK